MQPIIFGHPIRYLKPIVDGIGQAQTDIGRTVNAQQVVEAIFNETHTVAYHELQGVFLVEHVGGVINDIAAFKSSFI